MGWLKFNELSNVTVASRNIYVRPPEPPPEMLWSDPSNSIFVGKTKTFHIPFYWTYDKITNPHFAIVGITGSGKSYFIKTFLTRAALVWNSNAFIIDWAGEYRDWVKATGGTVISLGKGSYINLLDTGGMTPNTRTKQVMRTLAILTDMEKYPEQKRLTEMAIEKAYKKAGFRMDSIVQKSTGGEKMLPPTLRDVVDVLKKQYKSGSYEYPAEIQNAIYRLKQFTKVGQDFFARQSTLNLDKLTKSGMVCLDLSGLPDEVFRALAALSMLQFIKEKMRATGWKKHKDISLFVVLDEAWKIAGDRNSDAVMIVREGRKYNFSLIVASQNPTDINETIFSNVGTTFMFKVKFEKYLNYLQGTLNFSDYIRSEIAQLGVGQCAVNMAFTTSVNFPSTFMIKKVVGEEPLVEYFFNLKNVLTEQERRDVNMAQNVAVEREEMRRRLRLQGLNESQIQEVSSLFDKKNRHMDIVSFIILLQRYGLARNRITSLLKDFGISDTTIINIFIKADFKIHSATNRNIIDIILDEK
jgi:hypothetical protein